MHTLTLFSTLTDASQFTGSEHTRIVTLLTILALISVVMWTVVVFSIIARYFTKLIIRRLQKRILPEESPQKA